MIPLIKPQDRARDRWITVEAGPNILIHAELGFHHRVLLTENAVIQPPLNGTNGQRILLRIEQPASAKTVTLHSELIQHGDVVISTVGGSVSLIDFIYDHIARAWGVRGVPDLSSLYDDAGTAAAAITTHEGASNPHPTYLTQAEADAIYADQSHGATHLPGGADQTFGVAAEFTITNPATRLSFDCATVTTAQLAEVVATLLNQLDANTIPRVA